MGELAETVRRRDPDRYFCALFAPPDRREALYTLYCFNDELARALEVTSEPGLALIRLQWWREVVEGAERRHEVASPLRALLAAGDLPPEVLLEMIAAREAELEGAPVTLPEFIARLRDGAGGLAVAAGGLLGAAPAELPRLRDIGAAYGAAGTLRNVAALGARQRCVLPPDVPALVAAATGLLGRRAAIRRRIVSAALPGVLARRDLARATPALARGVGDLLAVAYAAVVCVV